MVCLWVENRKQLPSITYLDIYDYFVICKSLDTHQQFRPRLELSKAWRLITLQEFKKKIHQKLEKTTKNEPPRENKQSKLETMSSNMTE